WPTPARTAFLVLLLRDYRDPNVTPPAGATPASLRILLEDALCGPPLDSASPPLTPIAFLEWALAIADDRLLTLLSSPGPAACAAHPQLPPSPLPRLPDIPPLGGADRALLSLRVPSLSTGRATALVAGAGLERAGFAATGNLLQLVPSQWALPPRMLRYR